MNRSQTMEDLHDQLQMNIEANKELNQRVSEEKLMFNKHTVSHKVLSTSQVNNLKKERLRQQEILDQERVARKVYTDCINL